MMKKITISLVLILTAAVSFAGEVDKEKKSSEITPTIEVSNQEKTFDVNGLSACTGEFDSDDAVLEFNEETSTTNFEMIPLTEDFEESVTVEYSL